MSIKEASIYVAFRFHVNFYHSYRGDTPDEYGIGKDMRIIKYILDILDKHNAEGVLVKGTWDIENYYSLEQLMRQHCPELIERIKQRAAKGADEIEIMSYNNGLVSAHTEEEFLAMMDYTYSNENKSGLKDIFGDFAPIVRSQECMMTPALVKLYKLKGVEAITMFYSCIPFNGFSNFIPLLPTEKRYNPLWYRAPGRDDKIILMPCINPADTYDNFGLKALIKRLRKEQLNMERPVDLLITVDMDADDLFWEGYLNTALSYDLLKRKKTLWQGGLNVFINKLKKMPYVKFTTPYEYLKSHKPVGVVEFGQDTMDGSFDGFAPWSDKLENTKLWSGIERARTIAEYARAASGYDKKTDELIAKSMKNRILTLSTTHFGLSTPVMCKPRLLQAFDKVRVALKDSGEILNSVASTDENKAYFVKKYQRGEGRKSGLIRIKGAVNNISAKGVKAVFTREVFGETETNLVYSGTDNEILLERKAANFKPAKVGADDNSVYNGSVRLAVNADNELELYYLNRLWSANGSFKTKIKYQGRTVSADDVSFKTSEIKGFAAFLTEKGNLTIDATGNKVATYEKKYMIAYDLPYLYVDMDISYPMTEDYKVKKAKLLRLKRGYDLRWEEIVPLEIIPAFKGRPSKPVRVTKHNFFGDISYFDYNYGTFSNNDEFDSSNNALTCGFVAFSAGNEGLMLAQTVAADNKFAFCPVRMRKDGEEDILYINPFGTYFGKQLDYAAAYSGITMKVTMSQAEQFLPSATSYRGGRQQFSLMIAPFKGGVADKMINDAMLFAYPPYIKSGDEEIKMIDFTDWENTSEPLI
ncbi:MAG: hypothetical protein ACOX3U_05070 [Christensenellales bacterium]|jgi:hypothetical protein